MVRLHHRRSEISKLGSAIISGLAAGPANAISQSGIDSRKRPKYVSTKGKVPVARDGFYDRGRATAGTFRAGIILPPSDRS